MLKQRSIWSLFTIIVGVLIVAWLAMGLPALGHDEQNVAGAIKMFAFRLIVFTDLPLVELLIAGLVGWSRSDRVHTPSQAPTNAQPLVD